MELPTTKSRPTNKGKSGERYSAPALEKGLDILEALADQGAGLSQKQIAQAVGRSASEIFRMLACLESRGYVRRDAESYKLTARLFEIAHRHPPTKRLLDAALPTMRALARKARQSCHLAILHGADLLIVAQVDSPEVRSFAVRMGAVLPVLQTASGRVLMAWTENVVREPLLAQLCGSAGALASERARIEAIRRAGFERHRSQTILGIIDLSFPVLDHRGFAAAALTVPCLTQRGKPSQVREVTEMIGAAAREISEAIGGVAGAKKR